MIDAVIAFKKAIAELGFKKAMADIVFKKAVAGIVFKKAEASIAFKKAVARLRLGEFLIFRFFFDSASASDSEEKDVVKSVSDIQGMNDQTLFDLSKVEADQFSATDSIAFGSTKPFSDAGSMSDQIDKLGIGKLLFDATGVTECISIETGFNRNIADAFSAGESIQLQTLKAFADSSAFTDSADMSLAKGLADNSGVADSATLDPGKTISDSSLATEDQTMDFHKLITEAAGVTDDLDGEASADDDQEMTYTKVTSDLAAVVDSITHSMISGLSDTIGASDSGSLRGQNYCSFDYFAEDYVGYTQSF